MSTIQPPFNIRTLSPYLSLLVAGVAGGFVPANAAVNEGLLVPSKLPPLSLSFGNPTDYAPRRPDPAPLALGPAGERFHGTASVHLEETYPERPTEPGVFNYGGPGDSWNDLTLASPTPGNTAENPIRWRFDSRIHNRNGAVGYFTGAGTPERLLWTFAPAGQQVHFRVEWTVNFVGSPYEVRQCHFDIQTFQVICQDVTMQSKGKFEASVEIDGFGSRVIADTEEMRALGPGIESYSGSFSGVANVPYLGVTLGQSFYVGQSLNGDSSVSAEFRIYADSVPLPVPQPPALVPAIVAGEQLALSWPVSAEGYRVESTPDLLSPVWAAVEGSTVTEGAVRKLVITPGDGQAFYRLNKP